MLVPTHQGVVSGLLVGGLEHFFIFTYIGNVIIPTDEVICFRGGGSTTNQFMIAIFEALPFCQV